MILAGLRIDVDTLRGTRIGVPHLTGLLEQYHIKASFFFSVGPDNMGRHLWRLIRPAFMGKMLRTRATSLYGWDILLRGTFYPGPMIGKQCPSPMTKAAEMGHEIGLHAWDHYKWQTCVERMTRDAIFKEVKHGYDLLTDILGRQPDCFAAPAWRITPQALSVMEQFPFRFTSDCRGYSIFRPVTGNGCSSHVQVPTTLPTYDELIGLKCRNETYNDYLLQMFLPGFLNVLTIHAEVEGINCLSMFGEFLDKALHRDIVFTPLGDILAKTGKIEESGIAKSFVSGRDGWVACQKEVQKNKEFIKNENH